MTGQETRNKLTEHEIKKGEEYAILANLIHQEWRGVSVKSQKDLKGLKTRNLRDHMSEAEFIFTALAEISPRQIAETTDATGMKENENAAKTGGRIANRTGLTPDIRWRNSTYPPAPMTAPSRSSAPPPIPPVRKTSAPTTSSRRFSFGHRIGSCSPSQHMKGEQQCSPNTAFACVSSCMIFPITLPLLEECLRRNSDRIRPAAQRNLILLQGVKLPS